MIEQNWVGLIKPKKLEVSNLGSSDVATKAKLVIEPLERGFGITLGNAIRRVLLSSLMGTAVVAVKIKGVTHEFSAIEGVSEDAIDLILNLKGLKLVSHSAESTILRLKAVGPKVVTAEDILENSAVEVLNKDLVICNLAEGHELEVDIHVASGRGYSPVEAREKEEREIGLILVDAFYSPVERVNYSVEDSRVGQNINYDKLILEVETNGAVTPEYAVSFAAKILQDQLNSFVNMSVATISTEVAKEDVEKLPFDKNLLKRIDELEFSVRSANCLKNDNILYVGDLVQKTEIDMLRTPNFGRKSLNEIKEILGKMNLHLGMEVNEWPPQNIAELAKKYEDKY